MRRLFSLLLLSLVTTTAQAQNDVLVESVEGICGGGYPVSGRVEIEFTHTGGDFAFGTGQATVKVTLENTTPLVPFQDPPIGNPVMTGFYFNVPPAASVTFTEARIHIWSSLISSGTTMLGVPISSGCMTLFIDMVQTTWYELNNLSSTGEFGIFTNSLETLDGIKAGLVNPDVYVDCVAQGDVFSSLHIAGVVSFTILLDNLDSTLDSAGDFLTNCSLAPGGQQPSAFGAQFQGTGLDGEESCFIGEPGLCVTVPTEKRSWGAIKAIYGD